MINERHLHLIFFLIEGEGPEYILQYQSKGYNRNIRTKCGKTNKNNRQYISQPTYIHKKFNMIFLKQGRLHPSNSNDIIYVHANHLRKDKKKID